MPLSWLGVTLNGQSDRCQATVCADGGWRGGEWMVGFVSLRGGVDRDVSPRTSDVLEWAGQAVRVTPPPWGVNAWQWSGLSAVAVQIVVPDLTDLVTDSCIW